MNGDYINWNAIEEFVGFGPPDAPVVFIGMEEGLDPKADLAGDLVARSAYPPFVDLLEAQNALDSSSKFVGPDAKCQRTWRPMCDLMLRFKGETPTGSRRNWYQGMCLGRIPGETLLTELLPYPRRKTGAAWPTQYHSRFKTFEDYENALVQPRIDLLRSAIYAKPRKLIACYGKGYWPKFAELVNVKKWHGDDKFRYGNDEDTGAGVVLSWHYRLSLFNTNEQLRRFFDVAASVV